MDKSCVLCVNKSIVTLQRITKDISLKKKICDEILCQFLSDHGTIFFSLDLSVPWNLKLINIACHIIPN